MPRAKATDSAAISSAISVAASARNLVMFGLSYCGVLVELTTKELGFVLTSIS
jgi:hypothetical protein